jgi:glycine betaine/choline ABC-type transport system substrate-binding protein
MMIGSRLTFKAIQTAKLGVELRFNAITDLLTTLNKGFNMKQYENVSTLEIFASAILGALMGGLLALVYVYQTGGF